ncbi:MAG: alpha/beta hydrolase [Chloroflexota bacterium]|nr:alpha/beta hydrolase [Chloroflexota bacterium]MDE2896324.1 alpha/beta hydrolase [Chloroflexota bacterium]
MSAEQTGFDADGWTHDYLTTNGVRLHYVSQGEGPLVLLLHGFPEHWYSWRFQIGPLAVAGFRVVAPDLRGYNLSDKPRGGYDIKTLTKDVRGIIRALGEESATVVGHDWGGVIALQFPIDYPAACDRLIVMNAPLIRSWYWGRRNYPNNLYALMMQVPGLAERRSWSDIDQTTRNVFSGVAANNDAFTDEDIEIFAEALKQPKALSSAMKYYRSIYWPDWFLTWADRNERIACPTQFIWGREDRAVRLPFMEEAAERVDDLRTVVIDNAGHWVQQEQPDEVTAAMLDFLVSEAAETPAQ